MDRAYMHCSSLARSFFEEFPTERQMPLILPDEGQAAFRQLVQPLMDLQQTNPDDGAIYNAVMQLIIVFNLQVVDAQRDIPASSSSSGGSGGGSRLIGMPAYQACRYVAEYVQSSFALSIIEAAAACSDLLPDSISFFSSLSAHHNSAAKELLQEEIRRRFIGNGLAHKTSSCCCLLDKHPAVAAAASSGVDLDVLLLPTGAGYSFLSSPGSSSNNGNTGYDTQQQRDHPAVYQVFQLSVQQARRLASTGGVPRTAEASQSSDGVAGTAAGSGADAKAAAARATAGFGSSSSSILKRAARRRILSRMCSHYLAPLLGKDGPRSVLLVGSGLCSVIKGLTDSHGSARHGQVPGSSSSSTSVLAFEGYSNAATAQSALEGCLTEVLHRYFKRHPAPLTTRQGRPIWPFAVVTAHHLLLLLPEPRQGAETRGELPPITVAAATAAAAAGVDMVNPAAPGPAALVGPADAPVREVMLVFDLALHPSTEALLLSVTNALDAFAYDGDDVFTLPSAVRALASGAVLVNPGEIRQWDPAWTGPWQANTTSTAAAATAAAAAEVEHGTQGPGGSSRSNVRVAAMANREIAAVAAMAAAGWQPLLLVPPTRRASPAAAAAAGGDAICGGAAELQLVRQGFTSAGLAMQLPSILAAHAGQRATKGRSRSGQLPAAAAAPLSHGSSTADNGSSFLQPGHLLQALLIADVGGLLQTVHGSSVLAALVDSWPGSTRCCDYQQSNGAKAALWQQQLSTGSRWWWHLMALLDGKQQQQQQHCQVTHWLDLCVGQSQGNGDFEIALQQQMQQPSTSACCSQQQRCSASSNIGSTTTAQHHAPAAAAAAATASTSYDDEEITPAVLLSSPDMLRLVLDHNMHQDDTGGSTGHVRLSTGRRQRLLQQLRRDHGWVWGPVHPNQQQGSMWSSQVWDALSQRWWQGPVMRGSALKGPVIDQS